MSVVSAGVSRCRRRARAVALVDVDAAGRRRVVVNSDASTPILRSTHSIASTWPVEIAVSGMSPSLWLCGIFRMPAGMVGVVDRVRAARVVDVDRELAAPAAELDDERDGRADGDVGEGEGAVEGRRRRDERVARHVGAAGAALLRAVSEARGVNARTACGSGCRRATFGTGSPTVTPAGRYFAGVAGDDRAASAWS